MFALRKVVANAPRLSSAIIPKRALNELVTRPRNKVSTIEKIGIAFVLTTGIVSYPLYAIYMIPYWAGTKGGEASH